MANLEPFGSQAERFAQVFFFIAPIICEPLISYDFTHNTPHCVYLYDMFKYIHISNCTSKCRQTCLQVTSMYGFWCGARRCRLDCSAFLVCSYHMMYHSKISQTSGDNFLTAIFHLHTYMINYCRIIEEVMLLKSERADFGAEHSICP